MEADPHPPRVLLRPHTTASPPQNGVFVVGFIGQRHDDVSHLVNKVIDSLVFGSGTQDASFLFEPEVSKWLEARNLSYYHHKEQGIVFIQFSRVGSWDDVSDLEDQEVGDLQGLLFMFSVCHLIILIQEGSRFDTQMLKKFRVLQAAKNAMGPYVRSLNVSSSEQRASTFTSTADSGAASKTDSPGRTRVILNRNTQRHTGTTGLGFHSSLSPGQCIPVVLFVFLDDFTEIFPDEESSETSSISSSSNVNTLVRPGHAVQGGSSSVVVLARRTNKSEGGMRKKLQSSLEAQIRFSIKKCRTLSGFESFHGGSRTAAVPISAPLFTLDSSKAVLLIDACSVRSGESLEFAIGLVEEVLHGKATSDSLLLESHQQYKEDIVSVKEFIYKQSEVLRGKGGVLANNSGMKAIAAAVAAASTSSRKTTTAHELPTIEIWSSSCQQILHKILTTKDMNTHDVKLSRAREHSAFSTPEENTASPDSSESAISLLDNVIRANTLFSSSWCQRAYPVAKQVYLDGLPPCYPSTFHDDRLKKALQVLESMVKGPSVQFYLKKLKDECISIWSNGRQLCDAVSLTGNPCIHKRHETDSVNHGAEFRPHSSRFVYLHACACGRSRRLRPDPFDNEAANAMNIFADCDKLLPAVQFPTGSDKGFIQSSSWHIIRVGGARYYDPSKGLNQSGFCTTQRFLLKWILFLEKHKDVYHAHMNDLRQIDRNISNSSFTDIDTRVSNDCMPSLVINRNSTKNISLGGGFSNFSMKKPFSEVVAGAASTNSVHPPPSSKNPSSIDAESVVNLHRTGLGRAEKFGEIDYSVKSKDFMTIVSIDKTLNAGGIAEDTSKKSPEQTKVVDSGQPVIVYVGFEHECPHGHRFILSSEHLNELGSPFVVPQENSISLTERKQEPEKTGKVITHGRNRRQSNGGTNGGRARNLPKSKDKVANGNMGSNRTIQSNEQGKDRIEMMDVSDSIKDLDREKRTTITNHGSGVPLLNRTLPIFMKCPHCKASLMKNEISGTEFANNISQLQRIFVVTPSFPILLMADPVVQFAVSCLPPSIPDRETKLQFSLGCPVILPPESFLSIRLPFIYSVELDDGTTHSLRPFETEPHLTAYIVKGTTLNTSSNRKILGPELIT